MPLTTPPLTPAERHALVYAPFPIVRRLTTSYPWGGLIIGNYPFGNENVHPTHRFTGADDTPSGILRTLER